MLAWIFVQRGHWWGRKPTCTREWPPHPLEYNHHTFSRRTTTPSRIQSLRILRVKLGSHWWEASVKTPIKEDCVCNHAWQWNQKYIPIFPLHYLSCCHLHSIFHLRMIFVYNIILQNPGHTLKHGWTEWPYLVPSL